jgi:hypothetical protein
MNKQEEKSLGEFSFHLTWRPYGKESMEYSDNEPISPPSLSAGTFTFVN